MSYCNVLIQSRDNELHINLKSDSFIIFASLQRLWLIFLMRSYKYRSNMEHLVYIHRTMIQIFCIYLFGTKFAWRLLVKHKQYFSILEMYHICQKLQVWVKLGLSMCVCGVGEGVHVHVLFNGGGEGTGLGSSHSAHN